MDPKIAAMQADLIRAKDNPGPVDGAFGLLTFSALCDYASQRKAGSVDRILTGALYAAMFAAGMTTRLRCIHAIAQASVETDRFHTLVEYGSAAYFAEHYDGRSDLGNIHPGDGARFKGRGVIQCTGRANYKRFGAMCGLDLIADPDLAAEPVNAARIFVAYWTTHGINALADADDCKAVTRAINGGLNGYPARLATADRLKRIWPG